MRAKLEGRAGPKPTAVKATDHMRMQNAEIYKREIEPMAQRALSRSWRHSPGLSGNDLIVERWWRSLGYASTAVVACALLWACRTTQHNNLAVAAAGCLVVFSLMCCTRAFNPIAWAARPYKVFRRRSYLSCPIADQVPPRCAPRRCTCHALAGPY